MVGNKVSILSWKHMRTIDGKRAIKWAEVNNSTRTDITPQRVRVQAVCIISRHGKGDIADSCSMWRCSLRHLPTLRIQIPPGPVCPSWQGRAGSVLTVSQLFSSSLAWLVTSAGEAKKGVFEITSIKDVPAPLDLQRSLPTQPSCELQNNFSTISSF